jgi:hypothetical protein
VNFGSPDDLASVEAALASSLSAARPEPAEG